MGKSASGQWWVLVKRDPARGIVLWQGDGMVDATFHSPEWHAARIAALTQERVSWEDFKKKQKDEQKLAASEAAVRARMRKRQSIIKPALLPLGPLQILCFTAAGGAVSCLHPSATFLEMIPCEISKYGMSCCGPPHPTTHDNMAGRIM